MAVDNTPEPVRVVEPPDGTRLLEVLTDPAAVDAVTAGVEELLLHPGKSVLSGRRALLQAGRALVDPDSNASSAICLNNCSHSVFGNLTNDGICSDGAPSRAYCANPTDATCREAAERYCTFGFDCKRAPVSVASPTFPTASRIRWGVCPSGFAWYRAHWALLALLLAGCAWLRMKPRLMLAFASCAAPGRHGLWTPQGGEHLYMLRRALFWAAG